MSDRLVSIIVPIYNVEKYLDRCLLSIKEQKYPNIEVIMVNDGSKDSSRIIADKYQKEDKRFKLVDKENGGLSSARNCGMQYANGEFVSFIGSDDFIAKDYVDVLLRSFDDDTDIIIADYLIFDQNNYKTYVHSNPLNNDCFSNREEKRKLLGYLLYGTKPVMPVWKNMYRTSFYKEKQLAFESEREIYAEDLLFHVRAYSLARKVKIISKFVYYHLVVDSSLSQGYRKNFFVMEKELSFRIQKILEDYYDRDFVDAYKLFRPSIIGGALLHSCKCGFKESIQNVKFILSDNYVVDAYKNCPKRVGPNRYWILFWLGKKKMPLLSVIAAKLMILGTPFYRRMQKKQEYKYIS